MYLDNGGYARALTASEQENDRQVRANIGRMVDFVASQSLRLADFLPGLHYNYETRGVEW